jgi:Zn ribbon nucleic-acid-binding protein
MEDKIQCPVCSKTDCYVEAENNISSYLCMSCGYTTTSLNLNESILLRKAEQTTPELIKKSKYLDPDTNLVWYPSVLNFPNKGMIFPDGVNEDMWSWRVAKYIEIPEDQQHKYPIPNKEGEFYKTRLDLNSSKFFNRKDFKNACIDLGILQSSEE